jgi:hypothetical protein
MIDFIFAAVGVVLAIIELYVWNSGILWHDKPKGDPRNFPPQ